MVQSNPVAHLQNNAAPWWWKDKGLRSLALPIALGFSTVVSLGYDGAVMSGMMANQRFMASMGHPKSNKLGAIMSAPSFGGLPSLFPAAWLSDRYGRRLSMAIGYTIIIIGALVQTFTTGPWKMFGGRVIVGFGSSFCTVTGGPYTTEIAHPRNRAQTTALINTSFYVGAICASWVTFGTVYMTGTDWSWRLCLIFQVLVPILSLAVLPFCPESPRWLASRGRFEEAHDVLAKYHANGDKNDELVLYELQEIKEALELERAAKATTFSAFFKTKGNRRRLAIIIMIGFTSQWIGNGVISYYLIPILQSVGITEPAQMTGYNAGLQVFNWFAAIGGALVCERFGRRKMWLTSAIGMFFSYVLITGCSAAYANGSKPAGNAVLAFLFVFFFFYDIAYTGLTLAYPIEILPFKLRTKGIAILMLTMALSGMFNTFVNPIALESIAWKFYFAFIAVQLFAIAFIYFYFPETKGRMLEEIAEAFDGEAAALATHTHLQEDLDHKHNVEEVEYKA